MTIYDQVAIGDRAILHSGCVLGADGFGFVLAGDHYEKFPQIGRVDIGNDVEIGANSCVDRAALGVTEIGDGTKLDNMVHIGHNCRIGRHVVIAAQTGLSGGVVVEDYAVIGGQVGIGDKARIETGAVLGSGCGILTSKIVRKGQVVWGTPARPLKEHLRAAGQFGPASGTARGSARAGATHAPSRRREILGRAGNARRPAYRGCGDFQNRLRPGHQLLKAMHLLPRLQLLGRQRHFHVVGNGFDRAQRLPQFVHQVLNRFRGRKIQRGCWKVDRRFN